MEENRIACVGDPTVAAQLGQRAPANRILVVDDEAIIREISVRVLSRSGYHVDAVGDGAIAWDKLQQNRYDLLVTDNSMPKVTGVELLKKLYAARMVLAVIMVSGAMPHEEFIRCPWIQPTAMLPKPFTGDELLGTVKNVFHGTGGTRLQSALRPPWEFRPAAEYLPP